MVSSINFFETPYISVILLDIFWVKVKVQVEKVCQNTFFLIPTLPKIKINFEIILWPFSSAPYGTFKPDFYNIVVTFWICSALQATISYLAWDKACDPIANSHKVEDM